MKKNKWLLIILGAFFVLAAAYFLWKRSRPINGVTRKPLAEFISSMDFTPFTLPNNVLGPMTIFEFPPNGRETIIADKADCFPVAKYSMSETAIETYEQEVRSSAELNSVVDKRFLENSDLGFVFSDKGVKSVRITLTNPRMLYFSKLTAKKLAESASLECKAALAERKSVVVHAVLAADGIKVRLVSQENTQTKLNASVAAGAQAKADFVHELQQRGELTVANRTLYYGYRPFSAALLPGALGPGVEFEELKGDPAKKRIKEAQELGTAGHATISDRDRALAVLLRLYEPQVEAALKNLKQIHNAAIQRALTDLKVEYTLDETPFAFYADRRGTNRIFVSLGGLNVLDVIATAHAISKFNDSQRDWWFRYSMLCRQFSGKPGAAWPQPMGIAGLSPKDVSADTIIYQNQLLQRFTTFVVAHELGHLMLNHEGGKMELETIETYQKRLFAQEIAADTFAAEQVQRLGYSPFTATHTLVSHLLIFGNRRRPSNETHPSDPIRLQKIIEFYRNKKEEDQDTFALERLTQTITAAGPTWDVFLDTMAGEVTPASLNITGNQLNSKDIEGWISPEIRKKLSDQ